jgi:hypothetical protein
MCDKAPALGGRVVPFFPRSALSPDLVRHQSIVEAERRVPVDPDK